MKKTILFFLLFFLFSASLVTAQELEDEIPLSQRFPTLRLKDQFNQILPNKYYRFPKDTWFYEPMDLSYFPHENWLESNWALLGRWKDGKTYNQLIFLDNSASELVIHGTDVGKTYGLFSDFYLYADLFIIDNYPKDSGSCYIYYSNSMMTGFKKSKGILIDPENGIYESTNVYGKYYNQYDIKHELNKIQELDPYQYLFNPDNIEKTSIGSLNYPAANLDAQFITDWDYIKNLLHNPNASAVRVYRIEIIRENGISKIFLNGILTATINDGIQTEDLTPDKISISYGPLLKPGGMNVTCSIGDLYIYTK